MGKCYCLAFEWDCSLLAFPCSDISKVLSYDDSWRMICPSNWINSLHTLGRLFPPESWSSGGLVIIWGWRLHLQDPIDELWSDDGGPSSSLEEWYHCLHLDSAYTLNELHPPCHGNFLRNGASPHLSWRVNHWHPLHPHHQDFSSSSLPWWSPYHSIGNLQCNPRRNIV